MSDPNLNHTQPAHARDIVAAVRRRGLSRRHAVIAVETALTESRLRMYANRNNPASLALPHEAVGSDHGPVGLFQQQVGEAKNSTADWGTTAQLMDAAISTGNFLDALVRHDLDAGTDWQTAQSVQHSAFADGRNYRANDAEAQPIVDDLWDDVEAPTQPTTSPPPSQRPHRPDHRPAQQSITSFAPGTRCSPSPPASGSPGGIWPTSTTWPIQT